MGIFYRVCFGIRYRFNRRSMGVDRAAFASSQAWGTATDDEYASDGRGCSLPGQDRLSLALAAQRFSAVADGLRVFRGMARAWRAASHTARPLSSMPWYGRSASPSLNRHHRHQSVRTGKMGGERGYDGGKHVKGRKRHLVVDS